MNRERLFASTLLAGVASFGVPLAVGTASLSIATDALAQDYTNGSLLGTIEDENGQPVAGANVTITSDAQGFSRTLTTDDNGNFRVALLPLGTYTVVASGSGYQTAQSTVRVSTGEAAYTIALASSSGGGDEIVVTAARQNLDFSETTIGLSVDLDELTEQVPVGRNIRDVTLLAPGVVQGGSTGDATFAGQPVIGGASVAENAFYVNGLNITDFNTYIGGALVPFDFYRSVDIRSGGYSSEFGRATGGIINTVTRSGSNDWTFTVSGNYSPDSLLEDAPDTFQQANHHDEFETWDATLQVGGPIWRDHLFFYGLAQARETDNRFASILAGSYNIDVSDDPFYGAKIDFNITDRQRLEYTWFDTTRDTNRAVYQYDNATDTIASAQTGGILFQQGGESWVARYTGEFTDWFTLSGAYGITENANSTIPSNPGNPQVVDERLAGDPVISQQTAASVDLVTTEREFYRVDADFYFDLMGAHHVRAGYDNENNTLEHFQNSTGGASFVYNTAPAGEITLPVAAGTDYLRFRVFNVGGVFEATNEAYYIQDSWDILDNLTLNLGLRMDNFGGNNASGEEYISLEDNFGPRLGFSWNPSEDGRVFGNYGRYYLPTASNTAFRNAGTATDFQAYFTFTGTPDPVTGLPATTTLISTGAPEAATCPDGSPIAGVTGTNSCIVFSDGSTAPTNSFVAQSLEATAEDEYILGYERQMDGWNWRVTGVYRDVIRTQEDIAIDRGIRQFCADNGYAATIPGPAKGCNEIWNGFHQYVLHNPGEDLEVFLSDPLPGEAERRVISLTADQLLFPRAQREYYALEFAFERPFDGVWSLAGSYTLSLSEGNSEGYVNSDVGQDDSGITIGFDTPGLTDGVYGLLPNHRAHVLKLFGSYQLMENLLVGMNYSLISPKHYGCIGVHPISFALTGDAASFYGNSSFYCNLDNDVSTPRELTPRGSQFEGEWVQAIDLSARFNLSDAVGLPGDLQLRADIFNVLNEEGVTQQWEFGEDGGGTVDPNYQDPLNYQQPRTVRFGFEWAF